MMDIDKLFFSFKSLRVLIIGDVMVDEYSWGEIKRESPEAPVPIVDINKKEFRLGGAANVAKNISAMGAESILCGIVGCDEHSRIFIDLLKKNNISANYIYQSSGRKTTVKHRIFNNAKQVLRIDEEHCHDLNKNEGRKLMEFLNDNIKKVDIVILQDYDKGVLNKGNIKQIINIIHKHKKLVAVDPKENNFSFYEKVDLFKPNLKELSNGIKVNLNNFTQPDLNTAVLKLKKILRVDNVLLTLGDKGVYVDFKNEKHYIPTSVKLVSDVSGAGDTVISIAALLFVLKAPPRVVGKISNLAGGLTCGSLGVTSIDLNELKTLATKSS